MVLFQDWISVFRAEYDLIDDLSIGAHNIFSVIVEPFQGSGCFRESLPRAPHGVTIVELLSEFVLQNRYFIV